MANDTLHAHCKVCDGHMLMITTPDGIWFQCAECGLQTPPRLTALQASQDPDIVWSPAVHRHVIADRDRALPMTGGLDLDDIIDDKH